MILNYTSIGRQILLKHSIEAVVNPYRLPAGTSVPHFFSLSRGGDW